MLGRLRAAGRSVLRRCRGAFGQGGDTARVVAFTLLGVAATYLPRSWAFGLADLAGSAFYATPIGVRVRRSMRATFPDGNASATALSWLRLPFRDHVVATQIIKGRRRNSDWTIEQRNVPPMLGDPSASFIIATGHFPRQAMTGLYLKSIVPQELTTVIAPIDRTARSARAARLRLQMGEMTAGIRRLRDGDVEVAEIGSISVITQLLRRLREAGSVVIIAADAAWPREKASGYERPFASYRRRNVALGSARLSRISQRPIVTCVTYMAAERHIVMEWGEVIPPAEKGDSDADVRVTDAMLDVFERAIGLRPGQYVLPIGEDRYWDGATQRWLDPSAVVSSVSVDSKRAVVEPAMAVGHS